MRDFYPPFAEHRKRLRARNFMNQVKSDRNLPLSVLKFTDFVEIKNFIVERMVSHGDSLYKSLYVLSLRYSIFLICKPKNSLFSNKPKIPRRISFSFCVRFRKNFFILSIYLLYHLNKVSS